MSRAAPFGHQRQGRSPWLLLVGLLVLLLFGVPRAYASGDPFAQLASTNSEMVAQGVRALAVSGNPRAHAVIAALQAHKLFSWRWPRPDAPLFIRTDAGFVDARTGAPVASPPMPVNLRAVIVSDAVRGAIETAAGVLDLYAPEPATRRDAAEALFKAADPAALGLIDRALAHEKNASVADVLREARAAALLKSAIATVPARLAAIHQLVARADLSSRSLLASLQGQPPEITAAAQAAVEHIDRQLQMWSLVEDVYYGISLGAVLLLAAAGLAITFGVMG
ncbi:MAG: urea ABC transporter permease subunit UrtB, partial [Rhodospirillales bacterium]|nr:urea ABC transporter permease subunit UrtB [Rhodospirillales bacterium]